MHKPFFALVVAAGFAIGPAFPCFADLGSQHVTQTEIGHDSQMLAKPANRAADHSNRATPAAPGYASSDSGSAQQPAAPARNGARSTH